MKIGSLFSGIGGLELGLEIAGVGDVIWQVEIDPFRRAVLAKHWPKVERFEDVRTVGRSTLAPVDLICGGFPCRGTSSAGKRTGFDHPESRLWFEFARVVEEMRPRWVIVENVASGAVLWVDEVCRELGRQGYAPFPIPLAAADSGALHLRRRIFIVACLDPEGESTLAIDEKVGGVRRLHAHADAQSLRLEQGRSERTDGQEPSLARRPSWDGGREPEPGVVRVVHGLPRGLDGARVAALGDSVVPQSAEAIGHVVMQLLASE